MTENQELGGPSPELKLNSDKNKIWRSPEELAAAITEGYSVTDKEKIRTQYLDQVKQYPLYTEWFDRIDQAVNELGPNQSVIEYGSGPGILAGRLKNNSNVGNYTAVEPGETFREMTLEQNPNSKVVAGTAETYSAPESADLIVATAAYHHFSNKLRALEKIFTNLKKDGQIVIADVFLPDYEFDQNFNPKDKTKFVDSVMKYSAAQIKAMPKPTEADIEDQIRTAILDTLRIEELKVCAPIIQQQLKQVGFENINVKLMTGDNPEINYKTFGWYYITAKKPNK